MRYLSTVVILIAISLSSCGPSAEERAKVFNLLSGKIEETNVQIEGLQNRLNVIQARLLAEQDKLEGIKTFKLLRTADERAQQIIDQHLLITNLEEETSSITLQIGNLKDELEECLHDLEKYK
jgi:hypothetical protein